MATSPCKCSELSPLYTNGCSVKGGLGIGTGNMVDFFQPYQWVIDALRDEGPTATGEPVYMAGYGNTPLASLMAHSIQAMAAAVFVHAWPSSALVDTPSSRGNSSEPPRGLLRLSPFLSNGC